MPLSAQWIPRPLSPRPAIRQQLAKLSKHFLITPFFSKCIYPENVKMWGENETCKHQTKKMYDWNSLEGLHTVLAEKKAHNF